MKNDDIEANYFTNLNEKRKNVFLCCDPGHDDWFALILGLYHPSINLIGVSCVHGNQSVHKTSLNAARLLYMLGKDVPLIQGSERPIMNNEPVVCPEIHGESGLGVHENYQSRMVKELYDHESKHAKEIEKLISCRNDSKQFLHEMFLIIKEQTNVTICMTGCHTNIALLLLAYPGIRKHIERIVFLGGSEGIGNTSPFAEFNIEIDPEAAHIILNSNIPITMIPLQVSHSAIVTEQFIKKLEGLKSDFSNYAIGLLLFFSETYNTVFGFKDGPPLHDPCAMSYIINANIFISELHNVEIETSSPKCRGATVVDTYNLKHQSDPKKYPKNVTVCKSFAENHLNVFWYEILLPCLEKANTDFLRGPLYSLHSKF